MSNENIAKRFQFDMEIGMFKNSKGNTTTYKFYSEDEETAREFCEKYFPCLCEYGKI